MLKYLTMLVVLFIIIIIGFIVVVPFTHSSDEKSKVIMFGRSTMSLWFKHWNWPYPLRIKTTYKPWPIPYKKYSKGRLYMEYYEMEGPKDNYPDVPFGVNMLKSVEAGLAGGKYDAAFFKFCFVDFPVKEKEEKDKRLIELKNTVIKVHEMTSSRAMKLIIGNALPLPKPNEATIQIQRDYNDWLIEFASDRKDVMIFDLFGPLSDNNGRMIMELTHAKGDHHPGEKAFSLLDKTFFPQVEGFLVK